MKLLNATYSEKLGLAVTKLCDGKDYYDACALLDDLVDMTSTAGFDNDGSTGPEMIDNGIYLGLAAAKLNKKIFWTIFGDELSSPLAVFVLADDEDEAVRFITNMATT